jgi:hypothetical protein
MGGARRHAYRTVVTVAMRRGFDLICDMLPLGGLWYFSRSPMLIEQVNRGLRHYQAVGG